MPRSARRSSVLLLALSFLLLPQGASADADAVALYRTGRIEQARAAHSAELARREAAGDPHAVWAQLMTGAWLEESLGEPLRSLEFSHRGLELGLSLDDDFRTGRSLCWIGWSFANLGRYGAALAFFDRALELGAPGGRIRFVAVWGLATQEKGWVLARMGQLELAHAILSETTDFARRHGIDVGVAEGGAHLAEIARLRGDPFRAQLLAEEALEASLRCNCNASNTARARIAVARAALARSETDARFAGEALDKAREALAFSTSISDRRHEAEARLVVARALPPEEVEERIALARLASEALEATGADLRGMAEAEIGAALASVEQGPLARLYLDAGLEISESLFQRVDSAYVRTDLARLDGREGNSTGELERRRQAADLARDSGALALALENEERLSEELARLGYASQALDWTRRALATLDGLRSDVADSEVRRSLQLREAALAEREAELQLVLVLPAPAGPPPAS